MLYSYNRRSGSCKRDWRYSLCTDLARSQCYIVKCKKARYRTKYLAFKKWEYKNVLVLLVYA